MPIPENTWAGVTKLEVFAAPLAVSPKFQIIEVMLADVIIEKAVPLFKQVSRARIMPLQQRPIEIVRQIVVTGPPGSCNETQTLYIPGAEKVCVGKADELDPVIVIVSFIPLAGSPKFQKK